jgi:exopolysaccharide production protein ExoQ
MRESTIRLVGSALRSRRFSQALAELIVLIAILLPTLRPILAPPGTAAILVTLLAITAALFFVQQNELRWVGALPLSLGAFFATVLASVTWAVSPLTSIQGIAETLTFVLLGLYLAVLRDSVQVIRAVGNACRVVVAGSAFVEIINGVVLPTPLHVFGNAGTLAEGGPATGILESPASLGFVCLLALIAWSVEWRGHMAPRENLAAWVALCLGLLTVTRLPEAATALGALITVLAVTAGLRQLNPGARLGVNTAIATVVAIIVVAAVASPRSWFADDPSGRRDNLWNATLEISESRMTLGWGWVGMWPETEPVFPYSYLRGIAGPASAPSAHSSYLDVQLQLGIVGHVLLLVALVLAFVRGWLVASARRSAVHHWPVMAISLLAWWSITDSVITTAIGALVLVAAAMSAARNRSWRRLITAPKKSSKVR